MIRRRPRLAAATITAALVAAPLTLGASASPDVRSEGFCIPLLWCPDPDPSPAPSPSPSTPDIPGIPVDPSAPPTPADPSATPAPREPVDAPVDGAAPVFTGTPASMGSDSLSFTGLHGIEVVSVPTIDGGSIRALKITADAITIEGFSLTVRPHDGPGLVTTADTMSLQGDVTVYIGSVSASSMGGAPLSIGTDTPPPLTDVEPGLLDVTMGLVGTIADSITYANTDQRIVELE